MFLEILKNGCRNLFAFIVVLVISSVLSIPAIIGLALNCIPLVLFGILFFVAFGVGIAEYYCAKKYDERNK